MIRLSPCVVALALIACSPGVESDGVIAYRSTMDIAVEGVALHADGGIGHAGMYGTNCPFETTHGEVTGDVDLEGQDEEVQDVGESDLGPESVVLVLEEGAVLIDKSTGSYETRWTELTDVDQARLADDGVVALSAEACQVTWESGAQVALDGTCTGAFDVDTPTGLAFVGLDSGIAVVAPDGEIVQASGAALLAWDPISALLYTADPGSDQVVAVDVSGHVVWTTQVPGVVEALADGGEARTAAVSVAHADGTGALVLLDDSSGEIRGVVDTPAAARGVDVSQDGRVVAFVTDDAVHFYDGLFR
jgi:hypothetical protein